MHNTKTSPSCYNRESFAGKLQTGIYVPHIPWATKWREGCPHWYPGGNAHIRPYNDDQGGVKLDWLECDGCSQHTIAIERSKNVGQGSNRGKD